MTTYVKVTVGTNEHPTDKMLIGNMLAKVFARLDDTPNPETFSFSGDVTHEDFSALCVLEDLGLITVEQLGD